MRNEHRSLGISVFTAFRRFFNSSESIVKNGKAAKKGRSHPWHELCLYTEMLCDHWQQLLLLSGKAFDIRDFSFRLFIKAMLLISVTGAFVSLRQCCWHAWLELLFLHGNAFVVHDWCFCLYKETCYIRAKRFWLCMAELSFPMTRAFVSTRKCCWHSSFKSLSLHR